MAALDDIKSSLDITQLASMIGADPAETAAAVDTALGSLLSTMGDKVDSAPEAVSLTEALGQHVDSNAYADQVDAAAIDTVDGEKIVGHVYQAGQFPQLSGKARELVDRLLPILAPIVMSYVAKQLNGVLKDKFGVELPTDLTGTKTAPTGGTSSTGDLLGDLLGSVLGGQAAGAGQSGGSIAGSLLKEILLGR